MAWQDKPCIYIKKLDSYHQTDMKKRLSTEKVHKFPNIDVEYLISWYKSHRVHFGKLSKLSTETGAQELTQRDKRILHKLSW